MPSGFPQAFVARRSHTDILNGKRGVSQTSCEPAITEAELGERVTSEVLPIDMKQAAPQIQPYPSQPFSVHEG